MLRATSILLFLGSLLHAGLSVTPKAFTFSSASNRFLTPNGDGKNDDVLFTFANPRGSEVTGKIYDRAGKLVAGSLPAGVQPDSLVWNGKAGGAAVPSGLYVYIIESEGQVVRGIVAVVK